jgi:hypothetical protein
MQRRGAVRFRTEETFLSFRFSRKIVASSSATPQTASSFTRSFSGESCSNLERLFSTSRPLRTMLPSTNSTPADSNQIGVHRRRTIDRLLQKPGWSFRSRRREWPASTQSNRGVGERLLIPNRHPAHRNTIEAAERAQVYVRRHIADGKSPTSPSRRRSRAPCPVGS